MYLTDWRGNDYTVGDHVIYPTTYGSNASINEGIILEFIPYDKVVRVNGNSTIETHYKVKVQKVREESGHSRSGRIVPLSGTGKPSTLTVISRITKVDTP